jgi:hypothetical protein
VARSDEVVGVALTAKNAKESKEIKSLTQISQIFTCLRRGFGRQADYFTISHTCQRQAGSFSGRCSAALLLIPTGSGFLIPALFYFK